VISHGLWPDSVGRYDPDMIHDITPPICESMRIWPGDTPPHREIISHILEGDGSTSSTLRSTVHLGAHADAPCHYAPEGQAIDERSLDYYLGKCQVVKVSANPSQAITPDLILAKIETERVLIATGTCPDPRLFNEAFAALSTDLVDWLAECNVKTVGIDTPSVDLFTSEDLSVHKRCFEHDMALLENLALDGVPEGLYELIALPLRLVGFDASPVRAILRTLD